MVIHKDHNSHTSIISFKDAFNYSSVLGIDVSCEVSEEAVKHPVLGF